MLAPFLMTSIAIGQGGRIGAAPPPSARAIRFSTDEGTWVSLDVSPNGRAIAFELLGDIYIMPVGGGPARAILTGTAFQSQPRFSRDGASLTYVSDGDGSDNIWIAGPGGEHPRALTTMRRATMLSPEWSADGRSIYATVFEGRTADLWRFDVATGAGEKIVPNANGAASLLVSTPPPGPYGAHVTADGKWLYYASVTPRPYGSRNGASSRLVRRDLATGRDEPVTVEEPVAMKPVTSPNGALLAYGAQARGQT
ncbi:MAG: hypothetical protein EBY18_24465, partial [Alphaproteobacteria bacterium]|nr:hypothetical protein [Alphaproteobacteria bacterium]